MKIATTLSYKIENFERTFPVQKRVNSCVKSCYEDMGDIFAQSANDISKKKIDTLRKCAKECKMAELDLLHFHKNIDFLSLFKFEYCAKGCKSGNPLLMRSADPKKTKKDVDCYFSCWSRLDRRYRDYWRKKRDDLVFRYYGKDCLADMYN